MIPCGQKGTCEPLAPSDPAGPSQCFHSLLLKVIWRERLRRTLRPPHFRDEQKAPRASSAQAHTVTLEPKRGQAARPQPGPSTDTFSLFKQQFQIQINSSVLACPSDRGGHLSFSLGSFSTTVPCRGSTGTRRPRQTRGSRPLGSSCRRPVRPERTAPASLTPTGRPPTRRCRACQVSTGHSRTEKGN